jgi:acyl-CoA thioesterase FadM
MFIAQEIWRHKGLIAKAEVEAACLSLDGRPRRLPPEIIKGLGASSAPAAYSSLP